MLSVGDRVIVFDNEGEILGKATIVNFNDFREPGMEYAIDADFFKLDVMFCGEDSLVKIDSDED